MKIIQQVKMQNTTNGTVELETIFDDDIKLSIEDTNFRYTTTISKKLLVDFLEKLK